MSDHGRALEQGTDGGDVRALKGNLSEAVLGDLNLGARLPHLLAQPLHLGDGQAGIMRHDHNRRLRKNVMKGSDSFPSFPFYPRCSSPVGELQSLKTRLLHTPHARHGHPHRTPRPLAPVPGGGRNARRRTDGSNRFHASGNGRTDGELGLPRLCWLPALNGPSELSVRPNEAYAPAVSDRTKPERTQRFTLSVLRLFRRSHSDQPSPVSSLQGGSHV